MPDLLGLTVPEAMGSGRTAELIVAEPDPEYSPPSRSGALVIRQRPPAGTRVDLHSYVMVWAAGPEDGSGGEGGVREPLRPFPPVRENHAAADPEGD